MSPKNDNTFHVRLANIELTDSAKARIEAKLQQAVMDELAFKPNPDDDGKSHHKIPLPKGLVVIPMIEKLGKVIMQLSKQNFQAIENMAINEQVHN